MLFKDQNNKEGGFTLIEITIVMIISGLIVGALITSYLRWNDLLRSSKTKETMAVISDALSAYASRNFRVPCPANPAAAGPEPFGAEIGSGANGANLGVCTAATSEGILPFTTLGLDASFARDGWGNYFTYQVSPVFTQNMDVLPIDPPAAPAVQVHAKCRTLDWVEGVVFNGVQYEGGRNVALQKARFCCVQPDGSETQISSAAAPANVPSLIYTQDAAGWYDRANTVADPNLVANPFVTVSQTYYEDDIYGGGAPAAGFAHTDMPVYALISHGKNGNGAFLGNGGVARMPNGAGLSEIENANPASQIVYDLPHNSRSDNTEYDDIVSWQTQSDLMARLRRDSCAMP